jgi:Ca2+-binding RTX toxin-like protein
MAIVNGTNGDDTLYGTSDSDQISGFVGNDTLKGFGGADHLDGGNGWDTAFYDDSPVGVSVNLATGHGFGGTAEGDTLANIEAVYGSAFNDTLTGTNGSNTLYGLSGDDTLDGGFGTDYLYGGDGIDTLKGGGGADRLDGGNGDDTLKGGGGADVLIGGAGYDTVTYANSSARVVVSLIDNTAVGGDAAGDTFTVIENVTGSAHGDSLFGHNGRNVLHGLDGNDTLLGFGDNDYLYGGMGDDTLFGMDGYDYLVGEDGNDSLDGGAGNDTLYGRNDNDTLSGQGGDDYVLGEFGNDRLDGGTGNDTLIGGNGEDTLSGDDGEDYLEGDDGNDILDGGEDHDVLIGGLGADTMRGGGGTDFCHVDNAADVVIEHVGGGGGDWVEAGVSYTLTAGAEVELLIALEWSTLSIDVVGNEFNQRIVGNDGQNTIVGSPLNDGMGYDGLDVMTGRGGGDVFVWTSTAETLLAGHEADVVTDFNRAQGDLLAFNPIDANVTNGPQVNDAFTFVGVVNVAAGASFTAPGQVGFFTTPTDTFILLNTDADGFQEATIRLAGVHNVDASWFVL